MPSNNNNALDVLIVDLQGNLRGKRIPATQAEKALSGTARLPISTQMLDIWGDDCDHITKCALSVGDPDGTCVPALETLKPVPWRTNEQQVLTSLHNLDGTPSFADSRAILQSMDDKLRALGFTAVVAVELEFYVLDASTHETGIPKPPGVLNVAGDPKQLQLYDLQVRDRLEPLIDRIEKYAATLDIPITTSLLEFGPGQVEINFAHRANAVQAADDAVLFKRLVTRAAFDEGMMSTFMAKPYSDAGGSGMHTHVSLLDDNGNSVFDGSEKLLHACAGILDYLPDMLAVFAPHLNSWRRLQPNGFAPTRLDWGYEHRGVSVRIPATHGNEARLEQRVAGADANPYLVLTLLLAAITSGLEKGKPPAIAALTPNEKPSAPAFTHDWLTAINQFADSTFIQNALGQEFCQVYTAIKRHEAQILTGRVSNVDWETYLPQL